MNAHYLLMVRACERSYEAMLRRRNTDPASAYRGGCADRCYITEPGTAPSLIGSACCLYVCPESYLYKKESVLTVIEECVEMIERCLHEDGTWDFLATNYYTPATFEIQSFARGYCMLRDGCDKNAREQAVLDKMLHALTRMGEGCLNGGFHTPNHRWVESAALMMLTNITGRRDFAEKAERYLMEGIDCDEFGEFTERSMGCYNAVNVNALMIMAEEGNKPELYEYVKKTLDLSFSYLDWDGTLFTKNSRRQDAANELFYPEGAWYYLYLWAGYLFGSRKYLRFASDMLEDAARGGRPLPGGYLWVYEKFPALKEAEIDFADVSYETSYTRFFPASGILRARRGRFTATLAANKPDFLYLKFGRKELSLRMCASFFAVAQFEPGKIEKTEHGYGMYFRAHGEYKGQFTTSPETSDWYKMDHAARPVIHPCELKFLLELIPLEDGFDLHIRVFNTPEVPFKLEFCLPAGTRLETDNFISDVTAGGSMVIKSGSARFEDGETGAAVTVTGMFAKHLYHTTMRGSIPSKDGCFTLCCTDFSPLDRTLTFRYYEQERARRMDEKV